LKLLKHIFQYYFRVLTRRDSEEEIKDRRNNNEEIKVNEKERLDERKSLEEIKVKKE
jgi:hypothetical protein